MDKCVGNTRWILSHTTQGTSSHRTLNVYRLPNYKCFWKMCLRIFQPLNSKHIFLNTFFGCPFLSSRKCFFFKDVNKAEILEAEDFDPFANFLVLEDWKKLPPPNRLQLGSSLCLMDNLRLC